MLQGASTSLVSSSDLTNLQSPTSNLQSPTSNLQRYEVKLQQGDIIVAGTDGLWDNCFNEEILSVIKHCQKDKMDVNKCSQVRSCVDIDLYPRMCGLVQGI